MKLLRNKPLLLVLALLAGQWLSALHAGEHPLLEGANPHSCATCLHAQSGGAALPGAPLSLPDFVSLHLAPVTAFPAAPALTPTRSIHNRGPPAHLV